jgi:hypothetical protein
VALLPGRLFLYGVSLLRTAATDPPRCQLSQDVCCISRLSAPLAQKAMKSNTITAMTMTTKRGMTTQRGLEGALTKRPPPRCLAVHKKRSTPIGQNPKCFRERHALLGTAVSAASAARPPDTAGQTGTNKDRDENTATDTNKKVCSLFFDWSQMRRMCVVTFR